KGSIPFGGQKGCLPRFVGFHLIPPIQQVILKSACIRAVACAKARTMQTTVFLQAALNGDRIHPAAPRNPAAIAEAARAAVDAGAQSVHVHAFDDAGRETLDVTACAKVLRAIRALCPETPISLTTSATIVADPGERFRIVEAWEEMPDLVTANQGEPGIVGLCELLLSRGVG